MTKDPHELVAELAAWLRKRGLPDSGIRYYGQSFNPETGHTQSSRVELHAEDADFIAKHMHGNGATTLADAITNLIADRDALVRTARGLTKALVSLTGGGSEFFVRAGDEYFADIPRCIERISESKQKTHANLLEAVARASAAEARTTAAETERDDLKDRLHYCTGVADLAIKHRNEAEAREARMREALAWSLDEIDVLSNRLCKWAYPQGLDVVDRRDQLDNYRKAVEARRAALTLKETEHD